jgi:hypothetical protein
VTSEVDLEAELNHGHRVPSPNKNTSCHGDNETKKTSYVCQKKNGMEVLRTRAPYTKSLLCESYWLTSFYQMPFPVLLTFKMFDIFVKLYVNLEFEGGHCMLSVVNSSGYVR